MQFLIRSVTALAISIFVLFIFYFQNKYLVMLLAFLILYLLLHEWSKCSQKNNFYLDSFLFFLICFFVIFFISKISTFALVISSVFWLFFSFLLLNNQYKKYAFISFNNLFIKYIVIFGFFISIFTLLNNSFSIGINNFYLILILIFSTAISDSFAYIIGSNIGKLSLLSDISPNKTIEGLFGGLIATLIFGYFLTKNTDLEYEFMFIVFICSVFGFVGDYFVSLLKRRSGLKDTGSILPGHGGILDRIDSHLASFPISSLILILIY